MPFMLAVYSSEFSAKGTVISVPSSARGGGGGGDERTGKRKQKRENISKKNMTAVASNVMARAHENRGK